MEKHEYTHDNIITGKHTVKIANHYVYAEPHLDDDLKCGCIMCGEVFEVTPICSENNSCGAPVQTLFCRDCFEDLSEIFKRQRDGDYGW